MSEFEQLYREVILDHYKTPRNHGLLEPHDAVAEGQNPLCGDEVTVSVRFGDGDVIEERRLRGTRLRDQPGRDVDAHRPRQGTNGAGRGGDAEGRAARGDRDPADAGAPQVRAARPRRAQGRAPQGRRAPRCPRSGARRAARSPSASADEPRSRSARSTSCRPARSGSCAVERLLTIGVYNCGGEPVRARGQLLARRRPALRGRLRLRRAGSRSCPRHGARFDITDRAAPLIAARPTSRSRRSRSRVRDDGMVVVDRRSSELE